MMLVALIGKFGGLFASLPSPLISGLFCIMFGLIAAGAATDGYDTAALPHGWPRETLQCRFTGGRLDAGPQRCEGRMRRCGAASLQAHAPAFRGLA